MRSDSYLFKADDDQSCGDRYHTHPKFLPFPAKHISLRGAEEEKYSVIDVTKVDNPGGQAFILEEVEISRALFEIYEGGIVSRYRHSYFSKCFMLQRVQFIHQGLTFIVRMVLYAKVVPVRLSCIRLKKSATTRRQRSSCVLT